MEHQQAKPGELGKLTVSAESIGAMIPPVVTGISGVEALAGGRMDGWGEMVGVKKTGRGVKVTLKDEGIVIDVHIIVRFGCRIPEVARKIQLETKRMIEEMTGKSVTAVNVIVEGVSLERSGEALEKAAEAGG